MLASGFCRAALLLSLIPLAGCGVPLNGLRPPDLPQEVKAANAALASGDRAKATTLFDAAIRKRRVDPDVYIAIAEVCQLRTQWDLLTRYAEQGAQALPPSEREARARLLSAAGMGYDRLGDFPGSIRVYQEAVRLAPGDPDALNGLGYAYAEAGTRLDEAVQLTTKAIQIARSRGAPPEMVGAIVDSLGWAYYKLNKINDAVTTLASAADLAPGQMEIHYHLALAYRARGQSPDAEVELERAIALDTGPVKNEEIRRLLREVQAELPARSRNQQFGPPGPRP